MNYQRKITDLIVSKNRFVRKESTELSRDMREWQNSPSLREKRLLTYLRDQKHNYAMSMKGLSLAFTPNFIDQIKDEDYLKQLNPRFTQVGVTVGLNNNLIEILIVYIDT